MQAHLGRKDAHTLHLVEHRVMRGVPVPLLVVNPLVTPPSLHELACQPRSRTWCAEVWQRSTLSWLT